MEPRLAELLARRRAVAEPSATEFAREEPTSSRVSSSVYHDPAQIAILSQAAEQRRLREEENLEAAHQALSINLKQALEYEEAEKDKLKVLLQTKARAERIRLLLVQALPEGLRADGSLVMDTDVVGTETPVSIRLAKIQEELAEIEAVREVLEHRLTHTVIAVERIRGEREQVLGVLAATRKRRELVNRAAQLSKTDRDGQSCAPLHHSSSGNGKEHKKGRAPLSDLRDLVERRGRPLQALEAHFKVAGGVEKQRPPEHASSVSRASEPGGG